MFFVTTSDVGTLLGATYAALPPYLLTMTVALKRGAWTVGRAAALVNCLVYGFFFITKGNRGALVAVCCYLLIRTIGAGKNGWSKFMRAGVLIGGIVVVLNHVIPILEALNRALASFGIQADGINKTLDIWSAGQDIDNGRDYLWTRSLDALPCPETCVTGGGIGFAESTLGTYAHNLIIQHMMEGGILYALVPSVSVILAVWLLFRGKNWFLVASIAVTGVFIPLMLSNVYWVQPTYWLATYFLWSSPARSRSLGVASDSDEAAPSLKSPFGLKSGAQLRPYVAQ
ncbi:MAG: hypothetical protein LBN10_12265 [Propionibacteriaceae bacterium]|nr:hypothetical protein [Propionibacteriaceae bacterium]